MILEFAFLVVMANRAKFPRTKRSQANRGQSKLYNEIKIAKCGDS
jgi:hypothetical protein